MTKCLIIGGTGMLGAVSRFVASRYDEIILVARNPAALAEQLEATPVTLDWRDHQNTTITLNTLFERATLDLVISWVHDDGLWCIPLLESLLRPGGRSIRIQGSAAGDPAHGIQTDPHPPAGIARQNVVLGWIGSPTKRRWLTHDEISDGVIAAFNNPDEGALIVGQIE